MPAVRALHVKNFEIRSRVAQDHEEEKATKRTNRGRNQGRARVAEAGGRLRGPIHSEEGQPATAVVKKVGTGRKRVEGGLSR